MHKEFCCVLHALSCCADFYTPPVVASAMARIQQLASVKGVPFGGYTQAERQRVILGQPELVEALEPDPSQVCSMLVIRVVQRLLEHRMVLDWPELDNFMRELGPSPGMQACLNPSDGPSGCPQAGC